MDNCNCDHSRYVNFYNALPYFRTTMSFDTYIWLIQNNLQRGSEYTHYPALKNLLDNPSAGIEATIEEKGNKAGIPDLAVRRRELLVGYVEATDVGLDLNQVEKTEQLKCYQSDQYLRKLWVSHSSGRSSCPFL
jgi:hypothetical protein